MKISLDNLKNEIDTRIAAGGLSELSECQLQGASNVVTGDSLVPRVATLNDLPSAASSEGSMIYVDNINEYRFSNGLEWTDDVTSDFELIRGQVWSWGIGSCGRLGDGTIADKCSPVQEISSSTNWCQVSSGSGVAFAVKNVGTLWGWGTNFCGVLGDGTTADKSSPVQEISSSTNWCQVSAGSAHSTAVKTDGSLWSWGFGNCGALGDGTVVDKSSPVQEISSSTNWCQVSTGREVASAIKTDGTLWSWGRACCGNIGDGNTALSRCSPVREISSSMNWCQVSVGFLRHSSAVKTDGTLWSWGFGSCGRLGNGTVLDRCSPVREISSSTNWCQVSAGSTHSTAVKTDGTLWSWGRGGCGVLGDGTIADKCSPVQEISSSTNWCQVSVGAYHSAAVKTDGTIWSWGTNFCGRLGDGTVVDKSSPVQEISSATNWCQVSAGDFHSAAIKIDFSKGF